MCRAPPLVNVSETAPYSHAGSEYGLGDAIRTRVDPLGVSEIANMDLSERGDFYRRLGQWAREPAYSVELDDRDIAALVAFLKTLDFRDVDAISHADE